MADKPYPRTTAFNDHKAVFLWKGHVLCQASQRSNGPVVPYSQLKQRGIEASEGTVEDPELLMGIMAAREAVESADNKEELQRFSQTFEQQASNCIMVRVPFHCWPQTRILRTLCNLSIRY